MTKRVFIYLLVLHFSFAGCAQKDTSTEGPKPVLQNAMGRTYNPDTVYVNLDRFEKEIKRFESIDKTEGHPKGHILFVGSSSIRLWKTLAEDFAPMPVINRGFGGATMPEVIHYFDRIVLPFRPSIIVVYAGENDISFDNGNVDAAIASLNKFIQLTKEKLPVAKVIFISIKPSPKRWKFRAKFNDYNVKAQTLISETPGFKYADICPFMLNADSLPRKELFREDSLHLNSAGYSLWARELKPIVKSEFEKINKSTKHRK